MDGKPSLEITAVLERGYQLIDVSDRQEAKEFIEAWLPFNPAGRQAQLHQS